VKTNSNYSSVVCTRCGGSNFYSQCKNCDPNPHEEINRLKEELLIEVVENERLKKVIEKIQEVKIRMT
jgi:hypothetical protein